MKDRLKQIRKNLNLSQEEFGNKLGVTKAAISRLESGINNITEQMIKSVCREFNVNYHWFTTGSGEMFTVSNEDISSLIDCVMSGENEFAKNIFKSFAKFDVEDWKKLEQLIQKLLDGMPVETAQKLIRKQEDAEIAKELAIEEEVEAFRQELQAEQKGKILSASGE